MKKSFISLSVLSMLFIGLNFIVNAYSEEHPKDQPITTDTSNAFITASSNDISNPIVTNSLEYDTAPPTTASSEQESQTSLWDIEDENEVNYDSDQTNSPELAEQEVTKIKELYEKGISEGKVTRELYSYKAFQENYQANKTTYEEMKDIFPDYHSYSDWFAQIMNYAAFPDGEGHSPSETKREKRATKEQNANRFKRDIRKGDIIIVNSGGFGHAAIATSDNYILEMTGGDNPVNWFLTGISNNNNQFNKNNWLWGNREQGVKVKPRIDEPIQIWRVPNKTMANKCGTYADKTFWNSSGGYKKNRKIDYLLRSGTLSTNPNYCSKLVFQAYWYGSGNAPVVQGYASGLAFIAPSALPNLFTSSYKPYKVGSY
ncbi:hypothetical protein [Enterococcus gallinarum]|uniref:hypothetical protein n=1 Tax=Enterococcus gallinarum TaxID=1353 RepID=UPI001C60D416|nr:hypothetical protein [Enterococcus gallinarum]